MFQSSTLAHYLLTDQLQSVKGIGEVLAGKLQKIGVHTIRDLLLFSPLQYDDLSVRTTIAQLQPDELVTILAKVDSVSRYFKGGRAIVRAKISDESGSIACVWFNASFIADSLKVGESYFFSGKLSSKGGFAQPRFEKSSGEAIHTGRLVPRYSTRIGIVQGKLRHIFKEICDHLQVVDPLAALATQPDSAKYSHLCDLQTALKQLHFPDSQETTLAALERLATEEILSVIHQAFLSKKTWQKLSGAVQLPLADSLTKKLKAQLPFSLTESQNQVVSELLLDMHSQIPMNRLLVGDVGSGKTVVAGIGCAHMVAASQNAVLIAPTQILAEQHAAVLQKLFPQLSVILVTGKTKRADRQAATPSVYVGTQALFNSLEAIKPGMIIFDEQHRFGVKQRSTPLKLQPSPHVLTMSATPIPRSIMLTLFAHLSISTLTEMPAGRQSSKTWLVPEIKRKDSLVWMSDLLLSTKQQGIVICPYIDPSFAPSRENVAAATQLFTEYQQQLATTPNGKKLRLGLLHGRLSAAQKQQVIEKLYSREIDLLIATPMVEVGVDLPHAAVIVIENAEQFGLASLHQLRGRVGRAGQQGYCLLFSKTQSPESLKRLQQFSQETSGFKLSELDLENRGAGTLFGTQQHGFLDLQFANWTDRERISLAQQLYAAVSADKNWQPFFPLKQGEVKTAAN